jgi:carboxymethylenebutenolidase
MIQVTQVVVDTLEGQMSAVLYAPNTPQPHPAILLLMEAFGVTSHIQDIAHRLAQEGYVVLAPDLYYRESSKHTFGYDEVEQAMATMWGLTLAHPSKQICTLHWPISNLNPMLTPIGLV